MQDSPRFVQRAKPLATLCQVIQRSEQEDGIDLSVCPVQPARIAATDARERSMRLGRRARPRLLEMQRHGIYQVHRVAACREPRRVLARATADVQHDRWRHRQVPQEQLFGPAAFELAFVAIEPLVLLSARVEVEHFAGRLRGIVEIHSRAQSSTTIPGRDRIIWCTACRLRMLVRNAGWALGTRANASALQSDAESSRC